jgi:hypothetical protein
VNLPPQLIPPLHNQLTEDIKWVLEQGNEDTPHFQLGYVIGISKCYIDKKVQKIKKGKLKAEDYVFQKFEDFQIMQAADHFFMFDANTTTDLAGNTNQDAVMTGQTCMRIVLDRFNRSISVP